MTDTVDVATAMTAVDWEKVNIILKERYTTRQRILEAIRSRYDVTYAELRSPKKSHHLVVPRHITMWLLRNVERLSWGQIGQVLARDHSSCMYGAHKASVHFQPVIDSILAEIKAGEGAIVSTCPIAVIRKMIEAGFSDEEIEVVTGLSSPSRREETLERKRSYNRERMRKIRGSVVDVVDDVADNNEQRRSPTPPKEITIKNIPTEYEKEDKPEVISIFPDSEDIELALDAYRQVAEQRGLPLVRKMSDRRLRSLKSRLRDVGDLDGWYEACSKLQRSKFLCEIRADLDFMLQEKTFIRLLEGKYDDKEEVRGDGKRGVGAYSGGYR